MILAAFLSFLVVFGAFVTYSFVTRRKKDSYLAAAEYWVFLPETTMPDQDAIMTEMISRNPYSRRGQSPIGPPEGLIFSDIRLHIALVLRTRNPHAFRPDIFDEAEDLDAEILDSLENSQSFVKLRFVSEEPLKDKRHLQFLIHAADAVARLGGSTTIYDHTTGSLMTRERLATRLTEHFDATHPEVQVRTKWVPHLSGGHLETRGLVKIGLPEIQTDVLEADQQFIARTVLEEGIAKSWSLSAIPDPWEVEAYGDRFQILPAAAKNRTTQVRILRVQSV